VVLQVGDDSRGEPCRLELTAAAHAKGPPVHIHPRIEETFEVVSGRLSVRAGGEVRVLGPGEKLVVSPGTPHKFWNEPDREARITGSARPALRLLAFFEALNTVLGHGRPNPLGMAVIMREYRSETYPARPPLLVQKAILGIVAPIGRLLGYRA